MNNNDKRIEVTFKTTWLVKEGRKWVFKYETIVEEHKNESDAKLRALAENWEIVEVRNVSA